MEDINEDDIKKSYPSLPPNYVSLAQLQERWLQQQRQQEEQQQRQKKQILSLDQQNPKQKKRISRNEEIRGIRVDDQAVYVRRRRPGGNRPELDRVGRAIKSDGQNKCNSKEKKKTPMAKGGLTGRHVHAKSKDCVVWVNVTGNKGVEEGYSREFEKQSGDNEKNGENVSVCMAAAVLEIDEEGERPVGLNGKCGDEFSQISDDRVVRGGLMSRGKYGKGYDGAIEMEADDHENMEEGNMSNAAMLQGNAIKEEVPVGLRRKSVESSQGGHWRSRISNVGKDFKHNKLEDGQSGLDDRVSKGENERNGLEGKVGVGIHRYGGKERSLVNGSAKMRRSFETLSLNDGRESNLASRREPRRSYGNFGRFDNKKMHKVIDGDFVWRKKGETSDDKTPEI